MIFWSPIWENVESLFFLFYQRDGLLSTKHCENIFIKKNVMMTDDCVPNLYIKLGSERFLCKLRIVKSQWKVTGKILLFFNKKCLHPRSHFIIEKALNFFLIRLKHTEDKLPKYSSTGENRKMKIKFQRIRLLSIK